MATNEHVSSSSLSESSEDSDVLNLKNDEGWEDLEPDLETVKYCCLICDSVFHDMKVLLEHCSSIHNLDLVGVQRNLELDFLGMIRLVNYVRIEIRAGCGVPDLKTSAAFEDDRYLKPVLEDDALLYSLHDIIGEGFENDLDPIQDRETNEPFKHKDDDAKRIVELEEKLSSVQRELEARKREIEFIKQRFGDGANFESDGSPKHTGDDVGRVDIGTNRRAIPLGNTDSSYFESYSGHEIHATMLKDTVRTDAYRDFIYENKHLFKDKVVLDVGCGTGILSMFCARAGASRVIAVDNSGIIDFARENVYRNGLGETVTCLRGKIEEVVLPVKSVDIIVSEWMGYCLLYEAMLDSVLWARDQYLKPEGLMVPSHCTLRVAALSDPEFIEDHIDYWKDVYGFDMSSMRRDIFDDVMVRQVQDFAVPEDSAPFLNLELKGATAAETTFEAKDFTIELKVDAEAMHGFVIWFDTFFLATHDGKVASNLKAEDCRRNGAQYLAFTTGPHGRGTHWQQGVLFINYQGRQPMPLKRGQVIRGNIGYRKRRDDNRALNIIVQWSIEGVTEQQCQTWAIR